MMELSEKIFAKKTLYLFFTLTFNFFECKFFGEAEQYSLSAVKAI